MKVLIIGIVWPEPRSSAAGLRSWTLIRAFRDAGAEVHFASPANEAPDTETLRAQKIPTHAIAPNDPTFDPWILALAPDLVIFDRFLMEEQFGWRVRSQLPQAVCILDTVDLHFLRRAREAAIRQGASIEDSAECRFELITDDALREVAAIYRCDLSLLLSDFEIQLLCDANSKFRVPRELLTRFELCYGPAPTPPPFETREHFSVIGNFRHHPNADGVRWLYQEIWPLIRKQLPHARVDIYGAYPPKAMMDLNNERSGFRVLGHAPDQYEMLKKYRVNLAPLRFGAGQKGKIADGWWCGTPTVTTSIGAEGMMLSEASASFGGLIGNDAQTFAQAAVTLSTDPTLWHASQQLGLRFLKERMDHAANAAALMERIQTLRTHLVQHRASNFTGRMLSYHLHRSTEYFSRWIEIKNQV